MDSIYFGQASLTPSLPFTMDGSEIKREADERRDSDLPNGEPPNAIRFFHIGDCDVFHVAEFARLCMFTAPGSKTLFSSPVAMFFKLFRKSAENRPQVAQDAALADELARRVNAIEFKPSKGFLKDQHQPKRSAVRVHRSA